MTLVKKLFFFGEGTPCDYAGYATTYVTHELQSQVAQAEAATATQTSKISTTPQVTTSIIDLIDDESEEEQFDSDMDELGW